MIQNTLLIGGRAINRDPVRRSSPFYQEYHYEAAQAGSLDVAAAIGRARRAERASLASRSASLRKASERFHYTDETVEHTVRMTGVPIRVAAELLEDCRRWLRQVPDLFDARYSHQEAETRGEKLSPGLARLLIPETGICYAVTPGNDPRASALVAANLCYLGIPFIVKASPGDAVAPLVIQALIEGGIHPDFCNLLYFDHAQAGYHHRLVEASQTIWTFGPQNRVDLLLRYDSSGRWAVIDLPLGEKAIEPAFLHEQIDSGNYSSEEAEQDLFEGKRILRHDSGNCAAICRDSFTLDGKGWLYEAIRYPQGCTAVKSVYALDGDDWAEAAKDFLRGLRTGDPLDRQTEIGYVDPCALDHLDWLVEKHRLRAKFYGGERLSPFQARPLLVTDLEEPAPPDFLAEETPAYVLAVQDCDRIEAAVTMINRYTPGRPRLAVSLFNLTENEQEAAKKGLHTHAVLINRSPGSIVPIFHEGNDYANLLVPGRIVVS